MADVLENKGITQKELALKCGVSAKHISTIINGTKEISVSFAKCGIAFAVVKHFKGAPVQGMIKQTKDERVMLCITLRQVYADIFWFSLFHEIGHLLHGMSKNDSLILKVLRMNRKNKLINSHKQCCWNHKHIKAS